MGGGLGAPTVMAGLRAYTDDITGLIAVTDSGRSTGQDTLRHDSRRVAAAIVGLLSDRRPLLRAVE